MPASNVAAWETMAHGTTRKRIAEIASKLGVSVDYLMTGEPSQPSEPIVLRDQPSDPTAAPARSAAPQLAIRFTTEEPKAAECINHLVDYLNQIGADRDQLSWLLVELRKEFPLVHVHVPGHGPETKRIGEVASRTMRGAIGIAGIKPKG